MIIYANAFTIFFIVSYRPDLRMSESLCILEHKPQSNDDDTTVKLHLM